MKTTSGRRAVGAVLVLAACGAGAQTPPPAPARSYAVVSEVAREVTVVQFQESTGFRTSPNLRTRIPIPEGALDKVALLAAKKALTEADPGMPVWLVAPLDTELFGTVPGEGRTLAVPDDLRDAARQKGSTRLLVLSRFRGDGAIKVTFGRLNTETQLDGVGFYVDRLQPMRNPDTGQTANGFVAPYIYMRATLAELPSGRVLRVATVAEAEAYINTRNDVSSTQAWDALTSGEKVKNLAQRLDDQIAKAVSQLVKP